ncbi:bifunctional diguanylate cyclase/phosphodiesterase [Noviherbaspirillum autotrophicum]|uniref:bifunctional diguanylate cyclase/phosphodiesterase n=1 Tax=Noviherbaspirillum autotrophicum TaxID=709839 RepID=UPI0012FD1432|nr:EAL domain-containing protein [Noviherbaspirillum autotrophicum]
MRTLLTWLVLACLLPGVIGAGILFMYEYQAARAQQEKDMIQTARALTQAVDSHLLRAQSAAQALSTSRLLTEHDFAGFHKRAQEFVSLAGLGSNVVLRDANGRLLLNTAVPFGTPLPREPAREKVDGVLATGKPMISDLFIGGVLKRPIMSVDVPVIINGKITYSLGIGILTEHFNALLHSQGMPPRWVVAVINSAGTIVGRNHAADQFVGKKTVPALQQAMTAFGEGSLKTVTQEGTPVITSYSRSPVTHWGVAIGIPRQAILGSLWRTLSLLAIGVAALFGIGLVWARFVSRRIAYSFEVLSEPAEALGDGRSMPVPPVHVKEAVDVAAAIGRAGDLLQERAAIISTKDAELAEAHRLARFGSWYLDLHTCKTQMSDSLREIYGCEVPPWPGMRGTLLPEASWERLNAALQETIRSGEGHDLEEQAYYADGSMLWLNFKCQAVRGNNGEVVGARGTVLDITKRKQAEERLRASKEEMRNAALHDNLTGLPNRALVFEYGGHVLAAAQRHHGRGALLFIDLDRFKPINDLYGHETGDRVLQAVGQRLVECTRAEDLVGRLGGDEFVIILPHLEEGLHRAETVAQHVIERISQPFRIDALELSISPSIGISCFPDHAVDMNALIHTADLAMYQAKQAGRAAYQYYRDELDRRAAQALQVEQRLKKALKQHTLRLHYQPVIDIKSNRLVGAEALLRLEDNDGEAIGPDRFIPIAESTGLIGPLGEWVAAEACRQHQEWLDQGLKATIAINVSPLQFRQQKFAEKLSRILADTGMDPTSLEIEVTESAIMENLDEAVKILNRIKALGVKVALDDFGTGYSSLSSLSSLPLDKLKVDQSFVRRIERDQASRAVTDAIITLGRNLELEVHGEGIESEIALRYLQEHGCHQAQGYWFSRPLPAAEFARWYWEHWARSKISAVANE